MRLFRGNLDVVGEPCLEVLAKDISRKQKSTYQALKDTLAGGRAAGLDLPDVVLCNLLELELIRKLFGSHSYLTLA